MPKAGSALRSNFIILDGATASPSEINQLEMMSRDGENDAYYIKTALQSAGDSFYTVRMARNAQGEIIGAITYKTYARVDHRANGRFIDVYDLGTLSKFQGRGVGRSLMREAARAAASQNAGLRLTSTANAMSFYEKLGFKPAGGEMVLSPQDVIKLANQR